MDDEISISGAGWRCGIAVPGTSAGDCEEQRDADLRGIDQPGPCAYADLDSATVVGIAGGPVSERQEFAPTFNGVPEPEEEVLGAAPLGQGILGGF